MLQVGLDIPTQEMPEFVVQHLVKANDMPFVHLSGIDFAGLETGLRAEKIRSICNTIGSLTLSNEDPDSDIWILDSKTISNTKPVAGHTDNAHKSRPEDIVAFWNINSSASGLETVITPLSKIIELAENSSVMARLVMRAATKQIVFATGEESTKGTVINWRDKLIRYDENNIAPEDNEFKPLFAEAVNVSTLITLEPGEVLFFNNRTSLHAELPFSDSGRDNLAIRTRMLVNVAS
jgi:hypothetical protein